MLQELMQNLPAVALFLALMVLILSNFRIGRRKRRRPWLKVEGERKPPRKRRRLKPRDEL